MHNVIYDYDIIESLHLIYLCVKMFALGPKFRNYSMINMFINIFVHWYFICTAIFVETVVQLLAI